MSNAKPRLVSYHIASPFPSSLATTLITTLTSRHAIDEWSLQYPALQEVMKEFVWVRPMLEYVAFKLMQEGRWGVKARVFIGAAMSITDLATDIYVTRMFWNDETKYGFFQASLAR